MSEEASRKMLEEASRKMLTKKCWNIYKMLKKMFATFLKNVGEKILKKLLIKKVKKRSKRVRFLGLEYVKWVVFGQRGLL
jgi:sulfur relay (sulfurtransferase) DsrC/TusE family protein